MVRMGLGGGVGYSYVVLTVKSWRNIGLSFLRSWKERLLSAGYVERTFYTSNAIKSELSDLLFRSSKQKHVMLLEVGNTGTRSVDFVKTNPTVLR